MAQIITMGLWLTVVSFIYLKAPFFVDLFDTEEQHLTGYFVLFIVSALFNGFNVRDDGFGIFLRGAGSKYRLYQGVLDNYLRTGTDCQRGIDTV